MNFYLTSESLSKSNDQLDKLFDCLSHLLADIGRSEPYKDENLFYVTNSALEYPIGEKSFADLLFGANCGGEHKAILKTLLSLLNKGDLLRVTSKTTEEIKQEIAKSNEDGSAGIIALEAIENVAESNQIIYDSKTWIDFRRDHLGRYILDSDKYLLQCGKYYERLLFHDNNKSSIKSIFSDYKMSITHALNQLNDVFYPLYKESVGLERTALLRMFSSKTNLEAVTQGRDKKKLDAYFDFVNAKGEKVRIFCEMHIKLVQSDKIGDEKYEFNRIYFHEPYPGISNGERVLIAHIGKHLPVK